VDAAKALLPRPDAVALAVSGPPAPDGCAIVIANWSVTNPALLRMVLSTAVDIRTVVAPPGSLRPVYVATFSNPEDAAKSLDILNHTYSRGFYVTALPGADPAVLTAHFAERRELISDERQIVVGNIPPSASAARLADEVARLINSGVEDFDFRGDHAVVVLRNRNERGDAIARISQHVFDDGRLSAHPKEVNV
jgi:hypothetical protein